MRAVQWLGLVVLGLVALLVFVTICVLCWIYGEDASWSGVVLLMGIALIAPVVVVATFVIRRSATMLARLSTAAFWVIFVGAFVILLIGARY